MTREFAADVIDRIVAKLRFLLLVAMAVVLLAAVAGGALLAYSGWSTDARLQEVARMGIETDADIEAVGGGNGPLFRTPFYGPELAWKDKSGVQQRAGKVWISDAFWVSKMKAMSDGNFVLYPDPKIRIKYLPKEGGGFLVVIPEDWRRMEEVKGTMWSGLGLAGVGAIGSGLLFLFRRRRRARAATVAA